MQPLHNVDSASFALYCPMSKRFVARDFPFISHGTARGIRYTATPQPPVALASVRYLRYCLLRARRHADMIDGFRIVEMYAPDTYFPGMVCEYDNPRARQHIIGGARCEPLFNYLPAIEHHFNAHPERDDQYLVVLGSRLNTGPDGLARLADFRRLVPMIAGKRRCFFLPDKAALALLRLVHDDRLLTYDFQSQSLL